MKPSCNNVENRAAFSPAVVASRVVLSSYPATRSKLTLFHCIQYAATCYALHLVEPAVRGAPRLLSVWCTARPKNRKICNQM